jgi:hypothetical protein
MRFLPKGLNPFKIQTRFNVDLFLNFCSSKSKDIWMFGQKGSLFHLKQSSIRPSLEIFRVLEVPISYFSSATFESYWKIN